MTMIEAGEGGKWLKEGRRENGARGEEKRWRTEREKTTPCGARAGEGCSCH